MAETQQEMMIRIAGEYNEHGIESDVTRTHARYKADAPIPGYHILLTKTVRHMTADKAREVAADLITLADYADGLA